MRKEIQIIFIALLIKLAYFLFSIAADKLSGNANATADYERFTDILKKNDAAWYEKISTRGYPKITNKIAIGFSYKETCVQSAWAFFPFYPALNAGIMKVCNCDYNDSAFFLSIVFSLVAFVFFYRFCCQYLKDETKAFYITLLFMVFPFHYYFSVFYTEAVFFTFLILCFLAIHQFKEWLLPLFLIPLCLTRPNGIVLTLPLYLYYLERNGLLGRNYFGQLFTKKHLLYVIFYRDLSHSFFSVFIRRQ